MADPHGLPPVPDPPADPPNPGPVIIIIDDDEPQHAPNPPAAPVMPAVVANPLPAPVQPPAVAPPPAVPAVVNPPAAVNPPVAPAQADGPPADEPAPAVEVPAAPVAQPAPVPVVPAAPVAAPVVPVQRNAPVVPAPVQVPLMSLVQAMTPELANQLIAALQLSRAPADTSADVEGGFTPEQIAASHSRLPLAAAAPPASHRTQPAANAPARQQAPRAVMTAGAGTSAAAASAPVTAPAPARQQTVEERVARYLDMQNTAERRYQEDMQKMQKMLHDLLQQGPRTFSSVVADAAPPAEVRNLQTVVPVVPSAVVPAVPAVPVAPVPVPQSVVVPAVQASAPAAPAASPAHRLQFKLPTPEKFSGVVGGSILDLEVWGDDVKQFASSMRVSVKQALSMLTTGTARQHISNMATQQQQQHQQQCQTCKLQQQQRDTRRVLQVLLPGLPPPAIDLAINTVFASTSVASAASRGHGGPPQPRFRLAKLDRWVLAAVVQRRSSPGRLVMKLLPAHRVSAPSNRGSPLHTSRCSGDYGECSLTSPAPTKTFRAKARPFLAGADQLSFSIAE